ncbi:MAG: hypothetical protein MHPSP_001778 [Paramarteilia canceri]
MSTPLVLNNSTREILHSALLSKNILKGSNQVTKAIVGEKASVVLLSEDCDKLEHTKILKKLCEDHGIDVVTGSKALIGEACGLCKYTADGVATNVVKTAAAALTITKENAKMFLQAVSAGE